MTDTDRELLELAAKAAGMPHTYNEFWRGFYIKNPDGSWVAPHHWNPLNNDSDALRLAVKLGIHVMHSKHKVRAGRKLVQDGPCEEDKRPDPLAATRRAIVRAAAEIERSMT